MEVLLKGLNPRQKEAVLHTDGALLIVAGAGSGKTRVITNKIAYLMAEKKVHAHEITAMTFTNKAAGEMKERIRKILEEDLKWTDYYATAGLTVSTFHSFCSRVLRAHIDRLGISRDFVIYDSDDQKSLISSLLDLYNIDKKSISPREVVSIFSSVKNETSTIRQNSTLEKVYADYEAELRKSEALDFGDLLKFTVTLFEKHPDVLEIYQDSARFLFVDEYQDTNKIQYKLIRFLAAKHNNICVVGDEDQSIYRWRGADIRNILDFERDYANSQVIKLEENYRSTKCIISASSSLISKNTERKAKTLFTNNDEGQKIDIRSLVNDIKEAEFITTEIQRQINNGYDYNDIAIFYRINAQSRLIEEHLRRKRIPYKIIGGMRFYDRKEIKDLVCYLRLIVNPQDSVGLARVINIPTRGIGKTSMDKLSGFASSKGLSLYLALKEIDAVTTLSSSAKKKMKMFYELIEGLRKLNSENLKGSLLLKAVIDKVGYFDFLREKNSPDADERIDNISELLGAMADFEEENSDDCSINAFLESVALVADTDQEKGNDEGVKLMTLHSAKGLEFPVVFVQGLETGLLPYIRYGNDDTNDFEEERRLLYVGMTRAKKKLYLSLARSRRIFGGIKARQASQFIDEIDSQYVEIKNETQAIQGHGDKYSTKKEYASFLYEDESQDTDQKRFIGSKVQHATYGLGVVKSIDGKGEKAKVTIQFQRYGVKKLIWGYANLTVC